MIRRMKWQLFKADQSGRWMKQVTTFATFKETGWRLKKQFHEGQVVTPGFTNDGVFDCTFEGMSELMENHMKRVHRNDQSHEQFLHDFEQLRRGSCGNKAAIMTSRISSVFKVKESVAAMVEGNVVDKYGCCAEILQGLQTECDGFGFSTLPEKFKILARCGTGRD